MNQLTPDQREFYQYLLTSPHATFMGKKNDVYPELAHLKSPAERYKHLCENYKGSRFKRNSYEFT